MGTPDDAPITDPSDTTGKVTIFGLLKGLLKHAQGKGVFGLAVPISPKLVLPTSRQGIARPQIWFANNNNAMAAGGVWPAAGAAGYWVAPYRYIVGFAASDQSGSFVIREAETSGGTWYQTQAATNVTGSTTNPQVATAFSFEVHGDYMIPAYTNGAVAQANFTFMAWGVPS